MWSCNSTAHGKDLLQWRQFTISAVSLMGDVLLEVGVGPGLDLETFEGEAGFVEGDDGFIGEAGFIEGDAGFM